MTLTLNSMIKEAAALAGIHVTRLQNNPLHTFLGLRRISFKSIFDVGANEGQFARLIRRQFPRAKIYCFEPLPSAYGKLAEWAANDGNAVIAQIALSDSPGEAEINLHEEHSPSSSILSTTDKCLELYPFTARQRKVKVLINRLDDYAQALPKPPEAEILLKLDVQGFEAPVLRGASNFLHKTRALIVEICLDPLYERQSTFQEAFALADQAGLRYAGNITQTYGTDGHVAYLD